MRRVCPQDTVLSLGVQEMPRGAGHSEEVLTAAEDLRASRGWLGTTPNGDASSAPGAPASHSTLSPREPYPNFLKGAGFWMQARLAPLPALLRPHFVLEPSEGDPCPSGRPRAPRPRKRQRLTCGHCARLLGAQVCVLSSPLPVSTTRVLKAE